MASGRMMRPFRFFEKRAAQNASINHRFSHCLPLSTQEESYIFQQLGHILSGICHAAPDGLEAFYHIFIDPFANGTGVAPQSRKV